MISIVILISTITEQTFGSTVEWGSVGHKMDGSSQVSPYSHMAFFGDFLELSHDASLHITFHPQIAFQVICVRTSFVWQKMLAFEGQH